MGKRELFDAFKKELVNCVNKKQNLIIFHMNYRILSKVNVINIIKLLFLK